ncbi:hypothetical protein KP509_1Z236400 [Ceratopteris richardii]|nr:hypothetical protein KP509_1Z236400 [Ceratopteris richardii]
MNSNSTSARNKKASPLCIYKHRVERSLFHQPPMLCGCHPLTSCVNVQEVAGGCLYQGYVSIWRATASIRILSTGFVIFLSFDLAFAGAIQVTSRWSFNVSFCICMDNRSSSVPYYPLLIVSVEYSRLTFVRWFNS